MYECYIARVMCYAIHVKIKITVIMDAARRVSRIIVIHGDNFVSTYFEMSVIVTVAAVKTVWRRRNIRRP